VISEIFFDICVMGGIVWGDSPRFLGERQKITVLPWHIFFTSWTHGIMLIVFGRWRLPHKNGRPSRWVASQQL